MSIKIVTDSTCDLPDFIIQEYDITKIPVYINVKGKSYLDGIELSREKFYRILPGCKPPPTTSAPSVQIFRDAYESLAEKGATQIISIHISEKLSSIIQMARLAARETSKISVTVVDAGQISLGTGFMAFKAAIAALHKRNLTEILTTLEHYAERVYVFAVTDSLEYLQRSGRMSRPLAGLGTLLQIKPLLKMHKGVPEVERVRTYKRAVKRMIDIVTDLGSLEQIAFVHTHATQAAEELYEQAHHLLVKGKESWCVDVTPALGAHLGTGVVGFACVTLP